MGTSADEITAMVKQCALDAGFDLARVTTAREFQSDRQVALERLEAGLMDGLPWYTEARILRGSDPQQLLPGARSIISLGLSYSTGGEPSRQNPGLEAPGLEAPGLEEDSSLKGRIARYALGQDYHRVMKARMKAFVQTLSERLDALLDAPVDARWYVDDGPMLDRAAAFRSGLGWFGKNTNILTSSHGSWVFLGQVVTNLDLSPDQPLAKSCGTCTLCIEACPTGAIIEPYVLENPRCISHLTIENRGAIPTEFRAAMDDWVFGCDICQDVCPVNRKAAPGWAPIPMLKPQIGGTGNAGSTQTGQPDLLDLAEILQMTEDDFRARFANSPVKRARLTGLQRNACVALGNSGDLKSATVLLDALGHVESLIRGHAAWALGQMDTAPARQGLEEALEVETDPWVRQEIEAALASGGAV